MIRLKDIEEYTYPLGHGPFHFAYQPETGVSNLRQQEYNEKYRKTNKKYIEKYSKK